MSTQAKSAPAASVAPITSSNPLLQQTMKDLLVKGQYSDMKVICRSFTFNVHRAILCTQSPFFKAAMDGKFQEGITQTVNLPDDDLETIERVLSFLYLGNYNADEHLVDLSQADNSEVAWCETPTESLEAPGAEEPSNNSKVSSRSTAYNHIQVYVAADKYGIVPLKTLAAMRFGAWAGNNWKSMCFLESIVDVMNMIPPHDSQLREILTELICKHIATLVKEGTIVPVLETYGTLLSAILVRLVQDGRLFDATEETSTAIDCLARKVNSTRICRHCSASMKVKMESGEYQYGTIRCASCSTRHY